jgi:hypothetical protein
MLCAKTRRDLTKGCLSFPPKKDFLNKQMKEDGIPTCLCHDTLPGSPPMSPCDMLYSLLLFLFFLIMSSFVFCLLDKV